jgi:hypothetical protein
MPPRKKYVHSTTVRWSRMDLALFGYLNQLTHRTTNDELRVAIRFYARHHPRFDPEAFREWVERNDLPKTEKGLQREQFTQEVAAFLASFDQAKPTAGADQISAFEDHSMSFSSSARDFDLG